MKLGLLLTWMLGATFLFIQINEYVHLGFSIRDLAFGSIFYGLTGLHGAHVFVGLMLLSFATIRAFRGHFGPKAEDHLGVEVPGIYWHFVDVMWIIVYVTVYILVGGRCKPAHLGVLGRLGSGHARECAPLTSLPASTDLLGFRARA